MNHEKTATPTDEFEAIQTVHKALEPLSTEGRIRVVNYIVDLLELTMTLRHRQQVPRAITKKRKKLWSRRVILRARINFPHSPSFTT